MRIYKNRAFSKFARKERIGNDRLCQAIKDANDGKIDADYGGGLIKQRIARPNEGKSGGYRSIILFRRGDRAFFVYGFAKKDQENISNDEELLFKKLAKNTLALGEADIAKLVKNGIYEEVTCYD